VDKLRREFTKAGGARAKFLKRAAKDPSVTAGLSKSAIKRMEKGKVPKGMVVHHKKPIFRGGDSRFSNLELMSRKNHQANFQALHYYPD